ncbi:MAG TPA: SMI1/KNR4 family protein, partial [Thermomonospora sp.]|nr:SMI1/KNR4 family protein [Thermomonospora sp.]
MAEELWRRYRGRILFGPFVPFEDDELAALERETGRPLPAEYTAFLRVANGGGLDYAITIPPGKAGEPGADAEPVGFDELFVLGRDDDGGYGPGTLVG